MCPLALRVPSISAEPVNGNPAPVPVPEDPVNSTPFK